MRVIFESNEFAVNNGDFVFGDDDGMPEFTFTGGNDTFVGEDGATQYGAVGDVYAMAGISRGGNDNFLGGDDSGDGYSGPGSGVHFIGDALYMGGQSAGGRDYAEGGINSSNVFVGDASDASEHARGGNDTLVGGNAFSDSEGAGLGDGYAVNMLLGDFTHAGQGQTTSLVLEISASAPKSGNDSIVGGDSFAHEGQAIAFNLIGGDGYYFGAEARGGDDIVRGGDATADNGMAGAYNVMIGDAYFMSDSATGGKDAMYGGDARVVGNGGEGYAINYMSGDAISLQDESRAGNDKMYGGDARDTVGDDGGIAVVYNLMAGDAFNVSGDVTFGKDTLEGGNGAGDGYVVNVIYGDVGASDGGALPFPSFPFPGPLEEAALNFSEESVSLLGSESGSLRFGADKITGGNDNAINYLVGDAGYIGSDSVGGNDTLVAGDGYSNTLIGDSIDLDGRGGNDKLYSGEGDDLMWGDAMNLGSDAEGGADRFYFAAENGMDVINDFDVRDHDRIDLSAFGRSNPDFRTFEAFITSGRVEQTSEGALIHLDLVSKTSEDNTVLLMGVDVSDLVKASFAIG